MKFKSPILSQASGSVAGLTFSRNKGGMYIRQRAIPTNPDSPDQASVRGLFRDLAIAWNTILTSAQRSGWALYAENVLIPNSLGEPTNIGALPQFIRSNVARIQAGLARVDDAPTTYNLAPFTTPEVNISAANTVAVTFENTDEWAGAVGGALIVLQGRPVNPTINFYKGPWRFAGAIPGAATPPTSPQNITTLPFAVATGQKCFFQFRAATADGRLSTPFRVADVR